MLFGSDSPGAVDFAGRHVVDEELAQEVRDGLAGVGPHAGVEAEFERVFDFLQARAGVALLVVEGRARYREGFGLDG